MYDSKLVKEYAQVRLRDAAANAVSKAHVYPYMVTAHQQHVLEKYVAPRLIFSTHEKESSHPIAATMLHIANSNLHKFRVEGTIEIGADPRIDLNQLAHATYVKNDLRDNARHIRHAMNISKRNNRTQMQQDFIDALHADSNLCKSTVCFRGIEKCNARAHTIIANCATHDIPIEMWPTIFTNTGATTAYIWMYLPTQLVYPGLKLDNGEIVIRFLTKKLGPKNQLLQVGDHEIFEIPLNRIKRDSQGVAQFHDDDLMEFAFENDTSFSYLHNAKNWQKYLTTQVIDATDFSLVFEKVQWLGPMCLINITKSYGSGIISNHTLRSYDDRVILPNMLNYLKTGKLNYDHAITVRKSVADKIYTFAIAAPQNAFNTQSIIAYARALQTTMKIGSMQIAEGWEVDSSTFEEAVIRIMEIAMFRRTRACTLFSEVAKMSRGKLDELVEGMEKEHNYVTPMFFRAFKKCVYEMINFVKFPCFRTRYNLTQIECDDSLVLKIFMHSVPALPKYRLVVQDSLVPSKSNYPTPIMTTKNVKPATALKQYLSGLTLSSTPVDRELAKYAKVTAATKPRMRIITGVPGSGKSTYIRKTFPPKKCGIVTPINRLKEDYPGYTVVTQHLAILNSDLNGFDTIVVDEAFQLPYGYFVILSNKYPNAEIIACGDPSQIVFIDFEAVYPTDLILLHHCLADHPVEERTHSFRLGSYYAKLINTVFNTNITGSTHQTTFTHTRTLPKVSGYQFITFTQKTKDLYPGSHTVHEDQGASYANVVIVVSKEDRPVSASMPHWYVALTRASRHVIVYEQEAGALESRYNLSTAYVNASEVLNGLPVPKITLPSIEVSTQDGEDYARPSIVALGPETPDEVLNQVTIGHRYGQVNVQYYPTCGEALKINEVTLDDGMREMTVMEGFRFSHDTYITDKHMTLRTMISRYGKLTVNLSEAESTYELYTLSTAFEAAFIKKFIKIDLEAITDARHEQYIRQAIKGTDKQVNDILDHPMLTAIEHFLKQQSKVKTEPIYGADQRAVCGALKGKAGQGVSAWSKTLNTIMGAQVRALETAFKNSVRDGVLFTNGMNESEAIHPVCNTDMESISVIEGDIAEFDCNQNKTTVMFEIWLYKKLGASELFCDLYRLMRGKWGMAARDVGFLYGHDKQHSGQPSTLFGNSLVSLMLLCRVIDNIQTATVMVKGDDTLVLGEGVAFNSLLDRQNSTLHLHIKAQQGKPPQYVNSFITPLGSVPDVVRLAAKVKSKPFASSYKHIKTNKKLLISALPNVSNKCISLSRFFEPLNKVDPTAVYQFIAATNAIYPRNADYHTVHVTDCGRLLTDKVFAKMLTRAILLFSYHKLIFHITNFSESARASEIRLSVEQRLAVINSPEKYQAMIKCASLYYELHEHQVTLLYSWLHGITTLSDEQLIQYYKPCELYKALAHIEPEIQIQDLNLCIVDRGSGRGGECFHEVCKHIGVDSSELAPTWVQLADAIQFLLMRGESILVNYHNTYTLYTAGNYLPRVYAEFYSEQGHYMQCVYSGMPQEDYIRIKAVVALQEMGVEIPPIVQRAEPVPKDLVDEYYGCIEDICEGDPANSFVYLSDMFDELYGITRDEWRTAPIDKAIDYCLSNGINIIVDYEDGLFLHHIDESRPQIYACSYQRTPYSDDGTDFDYMVYHLFTENNHDQILKCTKIQYERVGNKLIKQDNNQNGENAEESEQTTWRATGGNAVSCKPTTEDEHGSAQSEHKTTEHDEHAEGCHCKKIYVRGWNSNKGRVADRYWTQCSSRRKPVRDDRTDLQLLQSEEGGRDIHFVVKSNKRTGRDRNVVYNRQIGNHSSGRCNGSKSTGCGERNKVLRFRRRSIVKEVQQSDNRRTPEHVFNRFRGRRQRRNTLRTTGSGDDRRDISLGDDHKLRTDHNAGNRGIHGTRRSGVSKRKEPDHSKQLAGGQGLGDVGDGGTVLTNTGSLGEPTTHYIQGHSHVYNGRRSVRMVRVSDTCRHGRRCKISGCGRGQTLLLARQFNGTSSNGLQQQNHQCADCSVGRRHVCLDSGHLCEIPKDLPCEQYNGISNAKDLSAGSSSHSKSSGAANYDNQRTSARECEERDWRRDTDCGQQSRGQPSERVDRCIEPSTSGDYRTTDRSSRTEECRRRDFKFPRRDCGRFGRGQGIRIYRGGIPTANCTIVHCVGADLKVSSGIAVQLQRKFNIKEALAGVKINPGEVHRTRHGRVTIYHLCTKFYSTKPIEDTYFFDLALKNLKEICADKLLCMPLIGTGNDAIPVEYVLNKLNNIDLPISLYIKNTIIMEKVINIIKRYNNLYNFQDAES